MEKNEIKVVKQPQDSANHSNLKEWVKPEMVELKVIHTKQTNGGSGTDAFDFS